MKLLATFKLLILSHDAFASYEDSCGLEIKL